MKLILVALLFVASTAQGDVSPRLSCPEEDVNLSGYDIGSVDGILTWEDCGED